MTVSYFSKSFPVPDGTTKTFSVPFPYLDKSHVTVLVDGVSATIDTWPSSGSVTLVNAPGVLTTVEIRRTTPHSDLQATFVSPAQLKAGDLNQDFLQALYYSQELDDGQAEVVAAAEHVLDAEPAALAAEGYRDQCAQYSNDIANGLLAKAPLHHTHPISDVVTLQAQLDALSAQAPRYVFKLLSDLTAISLTNTSADIGKGGRVVADTTRSSTFRSRTSNVGTVTFPGHGIPNGASIVTFTGFGGTGYNSTFSITSTTTDTIVFANTGSDEGSTADTNGRVIVNGEWTWSGTVWVRVADLDFSQLNTRLTNVEAQTAPTRTGGDIGDLPTKESDSDADLTWASRPSLARQPSTTQVWSGTDFEIEASNIGSLGTRYSSSVDGNDLLLTNHYTSNPWLLVCVTDTVSGPSKSFTHTVVVPAGINVSYGAPVVGWTSAPPSGVGPVVLPSDAEAFGWLPAGGFFMFDWTGMSFTSHNHFDAGGSNTLIYVGGDTLTITMLINDDETQATFYMYRNGTLVGSRTTTAGIPVNKNIFFGIRSDFTNGNQWRLKPATLTGPSFDTTKRIHLDPNIGASGGIGTEKNPFIGSDALQDIIKDRRVGRVELYFKPGIVRMNMDGLKNRDYRQFLLRGAAGRKTEIRCSEEWTSGWTSFTGSNGGTLWKHAYTQGSYGLVNKSKSQAMGRTGVYTHPETLCFYIRNSNLGDGRYVPFNQFDLPAHVNKYLLDPTGYAGYLVLNNGATDPNTQAFEHAIGSGLIFDFKSDSDWNHNEVIIEGLTFKYGVGGVTINRARARLENVTCWGNNPGGGFQFNQSDTVGHSLYAYATESDNFNMNGSVAGVGAESDFVSKVHLYDAHGYGCSPWVFGDNFSNHPTQSVYLYNCSGTGSMKNGWTGAGDSTLINFRAIDNVNQGILLIPYSNGVDADNVPTAHYAQIVGGYVNGSGGGVGILSNNNCSGTLDMQGIHTCNLPIGSYHVSIDKAAPDSAIDTINIYPGCTYDASGSGVTNIGSNAAGKASINIIRGTSY